MYRTLTWCRAGRACAGPVQGGGWGGGRSWGDSWGRPEAREDMREGVDGLVVGVAHGEDSVERVYAGGRGRHLPRLLSDHSLDGGPGEADPHGSGMRVWKWREGWVTSLSCRIINWTLRSTCLHWNNHWTRWAYWMSDICPYGINKFFSCYVQIKSSRMRISERR